VRPFIGVSEGGQAVVVPARRTMTARWRLDRYERRVLRDPRSLVSLVATDAAGNLRWSSRRLTRR
jgi:hypothetical protein